MNHFHHKSFKAFQLILIIAFLANPLKSYSQAPDTWAQKADFGGVARVRAVGFSIGDKGYIGTGWTIATEKDDFWEYDPASDSWSQKVDFPGNPMDGAVGFGIGTKGYIGTGHSTLTQKDFYEFDPAANTWTKKADFGGGNRSYAVGFSIGNKGYIGTGVTPLANFKDFWEYDPLLDTWTKKADFGGVPRYGAVGFSISGKGYLGTGTDGGNGFVDFWEYDPVLDTWTQKMNFKGASRYNAVAFSIGNKGFLGTGREGGTMYKDFWEYDPLANTWTKRANFTGGIREQAVGFSIGDKGYLGTGNNSGLFKDFREYTPGCTGLIVFADTDTDSFGDAASSLFLSDCEIPSGFVENSLDCNDVNASVNPSISEVCFNNVDDNCSGTTDEDCVCEIPQNLGTSNITFSSAQLDWDVASGAISYKFRYKVNNTDGWTTMNSNSTTKNITMLQPNTKYVWQVKSKCASNPTVTSGWSAKQIFTTPPLKSSPGYLRGNSFDLYPNPSANNVTIHFNLVQASMVTIRILDGTGKAIVPGRPQAMEMGEHALSIDIRKFLPGIYFVQMTTDTEILNTTLIVK